MYRILFRRIVGWLAGAVGVLALVLSSVGTAAADEDEFEKPSVLDHNTSLMPGCLVVSWQHSTSGVSNYTVSLDGQQPPLPIPDPQQKTKEFCSLEGGSTHSVEVCAVFGTDDADEACAPVVNLKTVADGVGEMVPGPPQGPLPPPPVKPILGQGSTEFGVEWGWKGTSDGHTYDYFNLRIEGPGGKEMKHDSAGNWGWQLITGLKPGTEYSVMAEGCDIDPIPYTNDNCSGWSPAVKVTTKPYELHSGADTCLPGFVWREAFQGDTVCVSPPRRDAVKADNAQASSRLNEGGNCTPGVNCTFTTSDTCKQGFVWREIRPEDHVCVSPQERELVKQENAMANQRRAAPR